MSEVGRVTRLFRYPVKSMLGETLDVVDIDEEGVAGDRRWAVRDDARGDFLTGKRVAALMSCRARYPETGERRDVPEIELPNGMCMRADDPATSKQLCEALSREVSLWPIGPAPPPAPASDLAEVDLEAEGRAMLAREEGEPLPDFSNLPAAIVAFMGRERRPFVDASPLLILSEQSVAAIAKAAPDSRIDVRRFRPSLLVDLPGAGEQPEQAWLGRRFKIGELVVSAQMACMRCVMTTHGFADLPKDPRVMRSLVRAADGNLGVYAVVETAGQVRVGDPVEPLD